MMNKIMYSDYIHDILELVVFSQRVVDEWNKLPKKVIDSKTINTFKSQLNNHWKNLDIKFK
jgi:hypothetical protein